MVLASNIAREGEAIGLALFPIALDAVSLLI